MKKLAFLIVMLLGCTTAFAQSENVEMADTLRSSGMIYVVVVTLAIIFVGIAVYLFSIDRRLKKIEKNK